MPITPYNFTELVGTAIESVLSSGQTAITASSIVRNREAVTVGLPCIEIDIAATEQASEQLQYLDPNLWDYAEPYWAENHFRSMAQITIASDRVTGEVDHADVVADVHYLMSRRAQSFVSPVVTLFEVLDITHAGTTHGVDEDDREDRTELSFAIEYGLLPGAFALTEHEAVADFTFETTLSTGYWNVTWTPPAETSHNIEIYVRLAGATSWGSATSVASTAGTATSATQIAPGDYECRVRYVSTGSGYGPWSSVLTDTLEFGAVADLTFSIDAGTAIGNFTWTPPDDPDAISIEFHTTSTEGVWSGTADQTADSDYLGGLFVFGGFTTGTWWTRARYKLKATGAVGPYTAILSDVSTA